MKRIHLILLCTLVVIGIIAGSGYYRYTHPIAQTQPATAPATRAATAATTRAVAKKEKPPTSQLLDILRADNPLYPTTQRLDGPLDLRYAAHAIVGDPIYLDLQGNLWIARFDAPAAFDFSKARRGGTATHVLREVVRFVLWSADERGLSTPHLVVDSSSGAGFDLLDAEGRRALPDALGFAWERAQVLYAPRGVKDRVLVPTATGICAFTFDQSADEIIKGHQRLIDPAKLKPAECSIQMSMDLRGVIAWVTDAAGAHGAKGGGIARYAPAVKPNSTDPITDADYRWTPLTGAVGWPDQILHLVPLLDGSVLQIVTNDDAEKDKVTLSINTIEAAAVDEVKIMGLVIDLSAADQDKRDQAFKTLTQYGPGIAPILEKAAEDLGPEVKVRIGQLLKNKIEPGLGGMSLVDGKMRLVSRLADGGAIFYSEAGVSIPRGEDQPFYATPAWLSIRPGFPVELLPPHLVTDLNPDKQKIIGWQREWVVIDPVLGPQWFIGNRLESFLRKSEQGYWRFIGIDATGRWLFRNHQKASVAITAPAQGDGQPTSSPATKPAPATTTTSVATTTASTSPTVATTAPSPATATASTAPSTAPSRRLASYDTPTLILDPRLPDTTPRLPAWELPPSVGAVGWDKDNWPVIYMQNEPKPVAWALQEFDWRVIDPTKEKVYTDPADIPKPAPRLPASRATTGPAATRPSTSPSSATGTATAPAASKPPLNIPTATGTTSPAAAPIVTSSAATTTASTQKSPSTTQAAAPSADEIAATLGQPLASAPDGTRYYDGQQAIKILRPDGQLITWPLPDKAIGTSKPTLLRTPDGLLFLINEPARIIRLREMEGGAEPLMFEALFTRKVPSDATPLRIWLDPANRLCIAHDGKNITVFFTNGRIPRDITRIMPAQDAGADEE